MNKRFFSVVKSILFAGFGLFLAACSNNIDNTGSATFSISKKTLQSAMEKSLKSNSSLRAAYLNEDDISEDEIDGKLELTVSLHGEYESSKVISFTWEEMENAGTSKQSNEIVQISFERIPISTEVYAEAELAMVYMDDGVERRFVEFKGTSDKRIRITAGYNPLDVVLKHYTEPVDYIIQFYFEDENSTDKDYPGYTHNTKYDKSGTITSEQVWEDLEDNIQALIQEYLTSEDFKSFTYEDEETGYEDKKYIYRLFYKKVKQEQPPVVETATLKINFSFEGEYMSFDEMDEDDLKCKYKVIVKLTDDRSYSETKEAVMTMQDIVDANKNLTDDQEELYLTTLTFEEVPVGIIGATTGFYGVKSAEGTSEENLYAKAEYKDAVVKGTNTWDITFELTGPQKPEQNFDYVIQFYFEDKESTDTEYPGYTHNKDLDINGSSEGWDDFDDQLEENTRKTVQKFSELGITNYQSSGYEGNFDEEGIYVYRIFYKKIEVKPPVEETYDYTISYYNQKANTVYDKDLKPSEQRNIFAFDCVAETGEAYMSELGEDGDILKPYLKAAQEGYVNCGYSIDQKEDDSFDIIFYFRLPDGDIPPVQEKELELEVMYGYETVDGDGTQYETAEETGSMIVTYSEADDPTEVIEEAIEAQISDYAEEGAKSGFIYDKYIHSGNAVVIVYSRIRSTYIFDAGEGKFENNNSTYTATGKYGAEIEVDVPDYDGYVVKDWTVEYYSSSTATTPAKTETVQTLPETFGTYAKVVYTAEWLLEETSVDYTIKYLGENVQGTEYAELCDNVTGTVADGTSITPAEKSFDGFELETAITAVTITEDNSVIEIKYKRKQITYTFDPKGGNWNGSTAVKTVTGKYGAEVEIPAPEYTGRTFTGWNNPVPTLFDKENLSFEAKWAANSQAFTITMERIGEDTITDTLNVTVTQTAGEGVYVLNITAPESSVTLSYKLYVDGMTVSPVSADSPRQFAASVPAGVHAIMLEAEDSDGNKYAGTSTWTVREED